MSTINEFPWQEDILRILQGGASVTVEDLAATLDTGDAGAVDHDVDHLADMGLLERDGDEVHLTREGEVAASRLP
jgi:Mn-dependent DtxR family transcriptional regulator